jgi:glycosidase
MVGVGMSNSLQDSSVIDAFRQATTPRIKQIRVDSNLVTVQAPFPSPVDWRDRWIYFLMIDRFNNPTAPPRHAPFDDEFDGFQGGTLVGVRAQLGYLQSLGVGAIWITPPLQNKINLNGSPNEGTYHGYGIQHFLEVDPRFGTEQDLIALVDEAHARGIYIIFDIVINHGGDLFSYVGHGSEAPFQRLPHDPIEWRRADGTPNPAWRIAPQDLIDDPELTPDAAVFPEELLDNRLWRRQGSNLSGVEGDFLSLKELKTDFSQTTPESGFEYTVRNRVILIHQYLIAKFDVDGFRIDTLKHVERPFARVFGNAMREYALSIGKKNFFTFGEVVGGEEELANYTGRFAGDPDDLFGVDAALDFPLNSVLPGVVKGMPDNPPSRLVDLYENRRRVQRGGLGQGAVISSHGEASRFFATFLDNHDRHNRFRFVDPEDPNRFDDQIAMGVGCLFGLQGIPVLYYGTEQGLHGSGKTDRAVREALWGKPGGFDTQNPFFLAIQAIAAIRANQPALRYGRQYFRQVSGSGLEFAVSTGAPGIIAFSRVLNDREVVVIANPFTNSRFDGEVLVDFALHPDGSSLPLLYSNKSAGASPPGSVVTKARGTVTIHGLTGGTSYGPCRAVPFSLQPMEIQILGQPPS